MRDALWVKIRCAGELRPIADELARFRYWLPYSLRPLLWELSRWITIYQQAGSVQARLKIEQEATHGLRMKLINVPEHSLLARFLSQVQKAIAESRKNRLAALQGKPDGGPDLDDKLVTELNSWLRRNATPANKVLVVWLMRMISAWREGRTESHS